MRKVFTLFALMSLLFVTAKAQITEKPAGAETMYVRSGSAFAPAEGSADLKVQSQAGKVARIATTATERRFTSPHQSASFPILYG